MNLFDQWWFYLILYLIVQIVFTQSYKVVMFSAKKDGPVTAVMQLMAGVAVLPLMPLFETKFIISWQIVAFWVGAAIFYALTDRLQTTVRKHTEVSTVSILFQIDRVFLVMFGLIIFKEEFVPAKIAGAVLVVLGNMMIFYERGKLKVNKYTMLGILSCLTVAIALSIDIGISDNFNLAFYTSIQFILPALLIISAERIKISELIDELKVEKKLPLFITSFAWMMIYWTLLRTYQLSDSVITVAPLSSITIILNVVVAYFFMKEKDSLIKKILAGVLVIGGVIMITVM